MELNKLNEAYTLVDNTENWMTSGDVTKDANGEIKINFYSTLNSAVGENINRWGSLYFKKEAEGNVTANYNFEGSYKQDFVDYCETLVSAILEQIEQ